jgi:GntR family transcriptional regulator
VTRAAAGSRAAKAGAGKAAALSNGTPIYAQLIMHFRHRIQTGVWQLGQTIPALSELATENGVTRATVRQAVGFLHREGLLSSRRGRGTEVIGVPRTNLWQQLPDDWEELLRSADNIAGDSLDLARPMRLPEAPQTDKGNLAPGYHVVRRLLKRDGIPYLVGTSYIDRRIIAEVGESALQRGSVYRAMEASRKFRPARGDQQLTLGMADAELAFLLEIPLNAAVVNVLRWVFDAEGTLIYQSEGQFRSDFVQAKRRLI